MYEITLWYFVSAKMIYFGNEAVAICTEGCMHRRRSTCGSLRRDTGFPYSCQCHPSCHRWGRCCLDYETVCQNPATNGSIQYMHNATAIIEKRQDVHFDRFFIKERVSYEEIIFFVDYEERAQYRDTDQTLLVEKCYNTINECPDSWPITSPILKKCQSENATDVLGLIPVSTGGQIYRNIYCALCHGLDLYSQLPAQVFVYSSSP